MSSINTNSPPFPYALSFSSCGKPSSVQLKPAQHFGAKRPKKLPNGLIQQGRQYYLLPHVKGWRRYWLTVRYNALTANFGPPSTTPPDVRAAVGEIALNTRVQHLLQKASPETYLQAGQKFYASLRRPSHIIIEKAQRLNPCLDLSDKQKAVLEALLHEASLRTHRPAVLEANLVRLVSEGNLPDTFEVNDFMSNRSISLEKLLVAGSLPKTFNGTDLITKKPMTIDDVLSACFSERRDFSSLAPKKKVAQAFTPSKPISFEPLPKKWDFSGLLPKKQADKA
jgi:hypothetical protein